MSTKTKSSRQFLTEPADILSADVAIRVQLSRMDHDKAVSIR